MKRLITGAYTSNLGRREIVNVLVLLQDLAHYPITDAPNYIKAVLTCMPHSRIFKRVDHNYYF